MRTSKKVGAVVAAAALAVVVASGPAVAKDDTKVKDKDTVVVFGIPEKKQVHPG